MKQTFTLHFSLNRYVPAVPVCTSINPACFLGIGPAHGLQQPGKLDDVFGIRCSLADFFGVGIIAAVTF